MKEPWGEYKYFVTDGKVKAKFVIFARKYGRNVVKTAKGHYKIRKKSLRKGKKYKL